jgi:polysaccharide biosynthesis transport protein
LQKQLGKQPEEAINNSYLSESPRYQKLLNELQDVEVELAKESVRFSAENPVILALEEKKAQLLPLLEQEAVRVLGQNFAPGKDYTSSAPSPSSLRSQLDLQYIQTANQIAVLEIRAIAIEEALVKIRNLVEQMPAIARKYTDLQRDLVVATESLNRFLAAQEELQLQAAKQALPWQLIAKPVQEEYSVSPSIPRNLALGMIGGLMLGFAAAILAERLDPVFHSSEEIKDSVKLPMLGIIPIEKDLTPLDETPKKEEKFSFPQLQIGGRVLDLGLNNSDTKTATTAEKKKERQKRYDASPFSEAFRSLNTNIKLLGSDSPINSIVISSSIPSEGKSTISSHLAQAAAAMGQRVLLIDADLRRPQVHRWTGLENKEGLSNLLSAPLRSETEEQELKKLIETVTQKPEDLEGLSVITAGDIPPDPTRLLSSQRMQKLMEVLKRSGQHDLIIYDTPPILGFADGRILASRTNGVVLVVRIGKTDRSLLKQNLDNLKVSHVPVLGLVANQANRNSGDSYHYYNHYYSRRD